jgi:hypothetical protein
VKSRPQQRLGLCVDPSIPFHHGCDGG